jgi:hypothetical protein
VNRIRQLWHYACKTFQLAHRLKRVRDRRLFPRVPHRAITATLFLGALLRRPSFFQIQADTHRKGWQKLIGYFHWLSDDLLADACEAYDPDDLREVLAGVNRHLKRNKVLEPFKIHGLLFATLDANEQFCSRHRCCEQCCVRQVEVRTERGVEKVTEYYHRQVYAHMSGPNFSLILDVEPLRPGEEECQAALRLLGRIRRRYGPRFFDGVNVDAWYPKGPFLKAVQRLGWGVVCVLKQERYEVYQETSALLAQTPSQSFVSPDWPQPRAITLREVRDLSFTDEAIGAVRVVVSDEKWEENHWQGGKKVREAKEGHWRWMATRELDGYPAQVVWKVGHNRWGVENHAFNELTKFCHLTHCPHHEPVAILVWLLFLILGFVIFEAFARLHCKLLALGKTTLQEINEQLKEALARWEELEPLWSG